MKKPNSFFVLTVLFWAVIGSVLATFTRSEIQLAFNKVHFPLGNTLVPYLTHLGDGAIFAFGIIFLWIRFRDFFAILFTALYTLISTAVLKQIVFSGAPRPAMYFPEGSLEFVDGVKMHMINSFPSGHTTAAFAFYGILALLVSKKHEWLRIPLFIIAIAVGFSRVYLNQHFLIDVWAGMALGLVISYLGALTAEQIKTKWIDNKL